jgi:topoisomerase IA-like protein
MTDLDSSMLFKVMQALKTGEYGAFMEHIGEAYLVADWKNQEKLLNEFGDSFESVYKQIRKNERLLGIMTYYAD